MAMPPGGGMWKEAVKEKLLSPANCLVHREIKRARRLPRPSSRNGPAVHKAAYRSSKEVLRSRLAPEECIYSSAERMKGETVNRGDRNTEGNSKPYSRSIGLEESMQSVRET